MPKNAFLKKLNGHINMRDVVIVAGLFAAGITGWVTINWQVSANDDRLTTLEEESASVDATVDDVLINQAVILSKQEQFEENFDDIDKDLREIDDKLDRLLER